MSNPIRCKQRDVKEVLVHMRVALKDNGTSLILIILKPCSLSVNLWFGENNNYYNFIIYRYESL